MHRTGFGVEKAARLVRALVVAAIACASAATASAAPVLFVTVTPSSGDTTSGSFGHFVSLVGSHRATTTLAPRGGDLWIKYDDGTLRNLTQECGYGTTAGAEITVREPNVHWNGQKAVFSMAVGGTHLTSPPPVYFQLYEITGILQGQTAAITKVPGQLANRNNIQPCYATDGSIIFASDEPASRNAAHYPPLDEYESTPSVHGLWRINVDGTNLRILDNCPSGDFTPFVDSFGRVIFTRWDHLKRDQQWDLFVDHQLLNINGGREKPYTYDSETSPNYQGPLFGQEFFPENGRLHPDVAGDNNPDKIPHPYWDQDFVPGMTKQDFNHFFPWMINEDGSDAEFLNHLGRHEMFGFVPKAWDNLPDFFRSGLDFRSMNMIREDPTVPGRYYAIDAPEFGTHGAGRVVRLDAPAGMNADAVPATMVNVSPFNPADWSGNVLTNRFRDPMIRQDGSLWVACTGQTADATKTVGSQPAAPAPYTLSSNYAFRIRKMVDNGKGFLEPGDYLIPGGINKTVTYNIHAFWPPRQVTYSGPMWELFPVEVVARPIPTPKTEPLETPEKNVLLAELGSDAGILSLRQWMSDNNLALIVVRDSTKRADKQQPFNLKVADSPHQSAAPGSTPTEIDYMQILHAEYLRTYGSANGSTPTADRGRRQIARAISAALNPPVPTAPAGGVQIAEDGSVAAFVPAGRATTWQLTESDGTPVVRERYWMTMRKGEIRFCHGCHGANTADVHGQPNDESESVALANLLDWWKTTTGFTPPVLKGDTNNDGTTNVADLTELYNHLAGLAGPPAGDADLDNNGAVNAADAELLKDHLANGTPLP